VFDLDDFFKFGQLQHELGGSYIIDGPPLYCGRSTLVSRARYCIVCTLKQIAQHAPYVYTAMQFVCFHFIVFVVRCFCFYSFCRHGEQPCVVKSFKLRPGKKKTNKHFQEYVIGSSVHSPFVVHFVEFIR
jgi:hypothetical protein